MQSQIDSNTTMKTFITEIHKPDGLYEGPRVRALSWFEAEGIVARLEGVTLSGELND